MTLGSLELPKHVKAIKWAPQNDVLAAQSTKVFVTHCGVNSIQESAYHGTPVVAVPFLGDQPHNAATVMADLQRACQSHINLMSTSALEHLSTIYKKNQANACM